MLTAAAMQAAAYALGRLACSTASCWHSKPDSNTKGTCCLSYGGQCWKDAQHLCSLPFSLTFSPTGPSVDCNRLSTQSVAGSCLRPGQPRTQHSHLLARQAGQPRHGAGPVSAAQAWARGPTACCSVLPQASFFLNRQFGSSQFASGMARSPKLMLSWHSASQQCELNGMSSWCCSQAVVFDVSQASVKSGPTGTP